MHAPDSTRDPWAVPTFLLWLVLFATGLFPQDVYRVLREFAGVNVYGALVNSPQALSIALALYLALFIGRLCKAEGLAGRAVFARAVFSFIVAYVAFMPIYTYLTLNPTVRMVATLVLWAKMVMWSYLILLFVRYFVLGNRRVFVEILPVQRDLADETPDCPASAPASPAGSDAYGKVGDEPGA